jgi:hypothetical protein
MWQGVAESNWGYCSRSYCCGLGVIVRNRRWGGTINLCEVVKVPISASNSASFMILSARSLLVHTLRFAWFRYSCTDASNAFSNVLRRTVQVTITATFYRPRSGRPARLLFDGVSCLTCGDRRCCILAFPLCGRTFSHWESCWISWSKRVMLNCCILDMVSLERCWGKWGRSKEGCVFFVDVFKVANDEGVNILWL